MQGTSQADMNTHTSQTAEYGFGAPEIYFGAIRTT